MFCQIETRGKSCLTAVVVVCYGRIEIALRPVLPGRQFRLMTCVLLIGSEKLVEVVLFVDEIQINLHKILDLSGSDLGCICMFD